MTREIKFRQPRFESGKMVGFDYWGIDIDADIGAHWTGPNSDPPVLRMSQQFTGLKDKNGVEIYESDIVEYKSGSPMSKLMIGLVMWQDFRACWAVGKPNSYNNDLFNCVRNGGQCKVIGNLFESPELLEAK